MKRMTPSRYHFPGRGGNRYNCATYGRVKVVVRGKMDSKFSSVVGKKCVLLRLCAFKGPLWYLFDNFGYLLWFFLLYLYLFNVLFLRGGGGNYVGSNMGSVKIVFFYVCALDTELPEPQDERQEEGGAGLPLPARGWHLDVRLSCWCCPGYWCVVWCDSDRGQFVVQKNKMLLAKYQYAYTRPVLVQGTQLRWCICMCTVFFQFSFCKIVCLWSLCCCPVLNPLPNLTHIFIAKKKGTMFMLRR